MSQPHLFLPITLRGLSAKNRILLSPMCQYSAIDGVATDWHLVHLGKFAQGGAGIVMLEATPPGPGNMAGGSSAAKEACASWTAPLCRSGSCEAHSRD